MTPAEAAFELLKGLVSTTPVAAVLFYAWREERDERRQLAKTMLTIQAENAKLAESVRDEMQALRAALDLWVGERMRVG